MIGRRRNFKNLKGFMFSMQMLSRSTYEAVYTQFIQKGTLSDTTRTVRHKRQYSAHLILRNLDIVAAALSIAISSPMALNLPDYINSHLTPDGGQSLYPMSTAVNSRICTDYSK